MCGARASGVRVFKYANESTMTGCTSHPGHEQKCSLHKNDDSPVLNHVPGSIKSSMRQKRTRTQKAVSDFDDTREDDELFIVEKILKNDGENYLVQCMGYDPTWMPWKLIPSFLLENFHRGIINVPLPRVKSLTSKGNTQLVSLSWNAADEYPVWDFESEDDDPSDTEDEVQQLSCNTRKDKDLRFHRHTCGIFIGCW